MYPLSLSIVSCPGEREIRQKVIPKVSYLAGASKMAASNGEIMRSIETEEQSNSYKARLHSSATRERINKRSPCIIDQK